MRRACFSTGKQAGSQEKREKKADGRVNNVVG
jgi:hypothetical protein